MATKTAKNKQIKYICCKCGVTVKAPEGLYIACLQCDYELSIAPTTKIEYEAALTMAFQNIAALTAQIEQLEAHLNPVDDDAVDAEYIEDGEIELDKDVDYVDGTNTPVAKG